MDNYFQTGQYFIILEYALYMFLIAVSGWTVYQIIKSPVKARLNHVRYRTQVNNRKSFKREIPLSERSAFYRHIYFLLESVSINKSSNTESISIYNFTFISGLLGFLTFILMIVKFHDAFISLIIAAVVTFIPYIFLMVRLRNMRSTVGNQLINIVEVLIPSYNASSNDMYQALKITQSSIEEPELRRVFIRLIRDLQVSRNEEEIRLSIDLFIYTCGNSWSMRLGNIILKSYMYQENVLSSLLQLQSQMINNEKMLEQEKTGSYDAFSNAMLTIILLPASLIGAKFVTRPQDWSNLQFGEKWPLLIFILTTVTSIIAVLVGFLIKNPKNDL